MFRRKKKKGVKEPELSKEEEKKIIEKATGKKTKEKQEKKGKVEEEEEKQEVQKIQEKEVNYTDYFIGKKSVVKEKKTVETKSGQIISLPEETERSVVSEIYQITQEDLVAILKGVDKDEDISQLALKMLTDEL